MSDSTPSRPTLRPELRIWDTVSETYASVFIENLRFLPRAALAPALLMIALGFLLQAFGLYFDPTATYEAKQTGSDGAVAEIPALLAGLVLYLPAVMFAVPWIRLTLLGPESAPPPLQPQWSSVHWRVLGYGAIASLGFLAVIIAGSVVSTMIAFVISLVGRAPLISVLVLLVAFAGLLIVFVFATAVMLRLLLSVPALLVGQAHGLKLLWQKSRGHNIALFVALLLVCVPFLVVGSAAFVLAGGGYAALTGQTPYPLFYDPNGPYFLLLLLWNTAQLIVWSAVFAAFIGIVYRSLFERFEA